MSAPSADALAAALAGTPFQARIEVHDELGSTIDRCRELAESGAPEGVVVLADSQSAGRGQPGRSWFSPRGAGLYLSVLLRPKLPVEEAAVLGPCTGLAACEALRGLGVPCRIKLPNDLVVAHRGTWRKLGGMLVDTAIQGDRLRHAILSLGVNVSLPPGDMPAELRAIAVSCHEAASPAPSREMIAATFLRELADLFEDGLATRDARGLLLGRHAAHVRAVLPGDAVRRGEE